MLVVERLEVIQIHKHQGAVTPAALPGLHRLEKAIVQQLPIRQLGQRVIVGQLVDNFFGLFATGDVTVKGLNQSLAVGHDHARRDLQRNEVPLLVVVQHLEFKGFPGKNALQQCRQVLQSFRRFQITQVHRCHLGLRVTVHLRKCRVDRQQFAAV